MYKLSAILSIAAVLSLNVYADSREKTSPPLYLFGKAFLEAAAGGSIDENYCQAKETVRIPAGELVPVSGIKSCESKYGGFVSKYFEIGYRGKIRYIDAADLTLTPKSLARLEAATEDELAMLRENAPEASRMIHANDLSEAIKEIKKTSKSGVAILKYSLVDESEHTEGTGYKITFLNSSRKTIKYINATIVGLNAVGDPVRAYFGRTSIVTLRGIGPISPDEIATYSKSYAWDTDVVQKMKITSLRIDFMDGSSSTLKSPASVTLDRRVYDLLSSEE